MQNRILRTPESCFSGLPGFPFAPHYLTLAGAAGDAPRMHYLDENAGRPLTALLLHGEPTWSFLYRHMIPPVVAAGFPRCGARLDRFWPLGQYAAARSTAISCTWTACAR
jgi:haloalkane dehalogenase